MGGGEILKQVKYSYHSFPLKVTFSVLFPFSLFMNSACVLKGGKLYGKYNSFKFIGY